jgi:hypothetical protein
MTDVQELGPAIQVILEQMKSMQSSFADALQRQQEQFKNEIKTLTDEIATIKSKSTTPPKVILTPLDTETPVPIQIDSEYGIGLRPASPPSITNRPMTLSVKIRDPEKFTGKRNDLLRFCQGLEVKLRGNADRYPDENSKLYYAWGLLDGDAATFMASIKPKNFEQLIAALEASYGDPHREATARRKLQNLHQGKRGFTSYFAEFQRYANESGWGATALIDHLLASLNDELKNTMIGASLPDTLEETANVINRHYNDLLRYQPNTTQTRRTWTKDSTQRTLKDSDAMDLDNLNRNSRKNTRRSSEERERFMKEGLCFSCGGKGHRVQDCPSPDKESVNTVTQGRSRRRSRSQRSRRLSSNRGRKSTRSRSNSSTKSGNSRKEQSRD